MLLSFPEHLRPLLEETVTLGRGHLRRPRPLRARAQREHDDARRHQHLGARDPAATRSVVVDPGPPDAGHLDAVAEAAGDVAVVLLTHHHLDHSEAARKFAERVGCGVRALDPAYRLGDEGLGEGDVVEVDGLEIRVVATPGHTADSLSFCGAGGERRPHRRHRARPRHDGGRAPRRPARRLPRLPRPAARAWPPSTGSHSIWPGHGPVIDDALPAIEYYVAHRQERLQQVEAALGELGAEPDTEGPAEAELPRRIVEKVYADVDPVLWGAAELSVRAQLAYLQAR